MDRSKKSPRKEIQLQGPRPTPLRVGQASHKIAKPPPPPPLPRQPVIIYALSPKVHHADARNFMSIVQRLTGPSPVRSRPPPLTFADPHRSTATALTFMGPAGRVSPVTAALTFMSPAGQHSSTSPFFTGPLGQLSSSSLTFTAPAVTPMTEALTFMGQTNRQSSLTFPGPVSQLSSTSSATFTDAPIHRSTAVGQVSSAKAEALTFVGPIGQQSSIALTFPAPVGQLSSSAALTGPDSQLSFTDAAGQLSSAKTEALTFMGPIGQLSSSAALTVGQFSSDAGSHRSTAAGQLSSTMLTFTSAASQLSSAAVTFTGNGDGQWLPTDVLRFMDVARQLSPAVAALTFTEDEGNTGQQLPMTALALVGGAGQLSPTAAALTCTGGGAGQRVLGGPVTCTDMVVDEMLEGLGVERGGAGILSPLPGALPAMSPSIFDPMADPGSMAFLNEMSPVFGAAVNLFGDGGVFLPSPLHLSPGWNLFSPV